MKLSIHNLSQHFIIKIVKCEIKLDYNQEKIIIIQSMNGNLCKTQSEIERAFENNSLIMKKANNNLFRSLQLQFSLVINLSHSAHSIGFDIKKLLNQYTNTEFMQAFTMRSIKNNLNIAKKTEYIIIR